MEALVIVAICLGIIIILSLSEIIEGDIVKKDTKEENIMNDTQNTFIISKKVGKYFYLDEINRQWTIPQGVFKLKINPLEIYSYDDIVSFELLEDGNSVSKGGVGRAIVGNVLFGGVGAIVGAVTGHKHKQTCTNLQVKITLNNIYNPTRYITFLCTETKKDRIKYKTAMALAQEVMSVLAIICDSSNTNNITECEEEQTLSNMDEVRKYKELFDMGAITQEEFETKRKELLNL